jgi:pimeloyl-ACP methyl ester carboxylesterase
VATAGRELLAAACALALGACVAAGTGGGDDVSATRDGGQPDADLVVLVHGMGRSWLSMLPLAHALEREGFRTECWDYASTRHDVPELCAQLAARVAALDAPPGTRVHFVGHSLGNLLIRGALGEQPPAGTGRVVMLAPPNRGAAAADAWAPWLGWLWKPLPQLGPGAGGVACTLPVPRLEIGIVAGGADGKVDVEETHLDGETDHVVVDAGHSFLMLRRDVQELTARFLREGRFATGP